MTRWERLVGLLLLLQSSPSADDARAADGRPWLTAARAAEHFGVSRRTILRDIAALGALGVPVLSRDGQHGGYALAPDYTPQALPLTLRETLLLLLALSSIEKVGATPYAEARGTLIAKLRAMIAPSLLTGADALLAKVAFEVPDRSGHPTPFLDTLFGAAQARRWVVAEYRSSSGVAQYRLLPARLSTVNGFWYCEASAALKEGRDAIAPGSRTFRLDRFLSVTPLSEAPAGVRVPTPREDVPYDHPSHPEVIVCLTERGVRRAESEQHLGRAVERNATGDGGMMRFRCPPSELDWAARYFFGFGPEATVLAPESLRDTLRGMAQAIISRYDER